MDELYDLEADPHEMKNLIDAAGYEDIRRDLRSRIIEHCEKNNDKAARLLVYSLKIENGKEPI